MVKKATAAKAAIEETEIEETEEVEATETLMADYDDALNVALGEIEAPLPIPVGTWRLKALSARWKAKQTEDDRDVVLFGYKAVEPGEDVDADELASADWKGTRLWSRVYIEGKADLFGLAQHMRKHGIDLSNKTTKQAIEVFNKAKPEIMASVGVRQFTDNTGTVRQDNTLTNFAPVGDEE